MRAPKILLLGVLVTGCGEAAAPPEILPDVALLSTWGGATCADLEGTASVSIRGRTHGEVRQASLTCPGDQGRFEFLQLRPDIYDVDAVMENAAGVVTHQFDLQNLILTLRDDVQFGIFEAEVPRKLTHLVIRWRLAEGVACGDVEAITIQAIGPWTRFPGTTGPYEGSLGGDCAAEGTTTAEAVPIPWGLWELRAAGYYFDGPPTRPESRRIELAGAASVEVDPGRAITTAELVIGRIAP